MRVRTSLALLCTLLSAGHAQAMSYGLAAFAKGSTALVAQGRIHRNEAGRLLSFLQQTGAGPGIPRTLVLSSPGGELVGALALGATLRQLGGGFHGWRWLWPGHSRRGPVPLSLRLRSYGGHRSIGDPGQSCGRSFVVAGT